MRTQQVNRSDRIWSLPGINPFLTFLESLKDPKPCNVINKTSSVISRYLDIYTCLHNLQSHQCITEPTHINLIVKYDHMYRDHHIYNQPIIEPVWTDPLWGRAEYCPLLTSCRTGPCPLVAVGDWIGSAWTSWHTLVISTLFLSHAPAKTWLIITVITAYLWIPTLGELMKVLSVYLVPSR